MLVDIDNRAIGSKSGRDLTSANRAPCPGAQISEGRAARS
jgi:hypothetical protein